MSAKAVFSREDVNLDTFLHFLLPSARSRHLCPCVPPDSRGIEHVSFRWASHFSSENRKNVADKEMRDCLGRLDGRLVKIRKSRDHSITQTHHLRPLQEEERVSDQTGQAQSASSCSNFFAAGGFSSVQLPQLRGCSAIPRIGRSFAGP